MDTWWPASAGKIVTALVKSARWTVRLKSDPTSVGGWKETRSILIGMVLVLLDKSILLMKMSRVAETMTALAGTPPAPDSGKSRNARYSTPETGLTPANT